MPNKSNFGTATDNAEITGVLQDKELVKPNIPPTGRMSVGPRVTLHLISEVWNEKTTYYYYDTVMDGEGSSYIAIVPQIPSGTPLSDTKYWFYWNGPNIQFEDLRKIVETFNQRIIDNSNNIDNLDKKIKNIVYNLDEYKNSTDDNYENSMKTIMNLIKESKDGGTILGNGQYNGKLVISELNVSLIGGTFTDGIVINITPTDNTIPSGVMIKGCIFDTDDNNGIEFSHATGIKITDCEFKQSVNASGIYCSLMPDYNQQIKQCIISNCRFYGGYSIFFESKNKSSEDYKYLSADTTITSCEMINLIGNIYMVGADGCVISNNTMFLSLGDNNKKDNIFLDYISMPVISSNQLFESGRCGIYIGKGQNGSISNNNIIWPNQYEKLAGIYIEEGKIGSNDNLALMGISNNVIDHPVGDGIFVKKEATFLIGNNIAYAGSKDHWKGKVDPPDTKVYAINAAVKVTNAIGNTTLGTSEFNFLDSKDLSNNANYLNFGTNGFYNASYRYFGTEIITITKNTDTIEYTSKMPFVVIDNLSSIDEKTLMGINTPNIPKLGIIICYTTDCNINDHIIQVQKPEMFIIYSNNLYWFK